MNGLPLFLRRSVQGLVLIALGAAVATGAMSLVEAHGGDVALIHSCVNSQGGIRIVSASEECKASETALDWNIQGVEGEQGVPGPAGPAGATGPAGPAGPAGSARAFAAIAPDGVAGGPALRSPNKGFESVAYEPFGPVGSNIYCLVPTVDSGLSPLDSVILVSLGSAGGNVSEGASVAQAGICTDDPTGESGWAVITWGPSGGVSDIVGFTVLVP